MNFRRPVVLVWLFVIFTAIGVFFALHGYLDDVAAHVHGTLAERFLEEMTGAYSAMVLIPLLAWVARRYPIERAHLGRAIAANIGALLVYTIVHTTLIYGLRYPIAPLLGIHYDYSTMLLRYPMEGAGDVVYYGLLMTSLYLIDHFVASRELETKLAQAKLENLRLQLHPHFLFNTLNAISSVMYEDVEKADAMLAKLSTFLRTVLDSNSVHTVSIDEELAIERMYVDIMTTRLERTLELRVDVAEDAKESEVPFMLLQPLIENSIRHGMGSSRGSLELAIEVRRSNGTTVIDVIDNGLGYEASATPGIGLSNVSSRLAYMYGAAGSFAIAARPGGGTRATVQYPYRAERA